KAVVMNVVSLGATFGVMSAVFEHGFLAGQLGMIKVAGLNPFVVVIVFAFAFGLSMDYEVFLLGRIKEYVDRGLETDHAVRPGRPRDHGARGRPCHVDRSISSQSAGGSWYGPRNITAHSSAQRRCPMALESMRPGSGMRRRSAVRYAQSRQ